MTVLCRIFGHDDDWTFPPDPRPREHLPSGRAKLRKAYMVKFCRRCGRREAVNGT